jgi:hypothetical protein
MSVEQEIRHGEQILQAGPVLARQVHPLRGFNQALAIRITDKIGSMWAAYLFAALALISLPVAIASGSLLVLVGWIAQTFLQLVLLPVILVGQKAEAAHADARSEQDHALHVAAHAKLDELLKLAGG